MQAIHKAHPFFNDLFAPPREVFQLVVDQRGGSHFLQYVFCQWQVCGEPKQFEDAPRIDGVGLGGRGKDFFIAGELEVVDAVETIAMPANVSIQRACPAIKTFHGNGYRQGVSPFNSVDASNSDWHHPGRRIG